MLVDGNPYHTIWLSRDDETIVEIIDQRWLPHEFRIVQLRSVEDAYNAIRDMYVRGAPLIGATAAYGMYLAALERREDNLEREHVFAAAEHLRSARPTAVNLAWALDSICAVLRGIDDTSEFVSVTRARAKAIVDRELYSCQKIGEHGVSLFEELAERKPGETINVLTHCNAGWLACIDYGTATAPIYAAHKQGIPVHVWVDETRPRNQGAGLTAWELGQEGVSHTVICDNAGGHLMQHGLVDLVIVGTDRTTRAGDVANKVGTYLKALAAHDNGVPFYVALPSSSIDWGITDGMAIPIEERDGEEVRCVQGTIDGQIKSVRITPEASPVANYAFDVTPARLVTGFITEDGCCAANEVGLLELFPERKCG